MTADAIARRLGVNRVSFAAVTPDASVATVEFARGCDGTTEEGAYPLVEYLADSARADLAAGRSVVVADIADDPRTAFARERFFEIGVSAFVSVPLFNDTGLKATLNVNMKDPREWQPDEVALLEHVAARLWPAVERARAEEALRRSEQRHEFLFRLLEALRPLSDPRDIQEVTARLLGERLNVNRVNYSEIDGAEFIARISYTKDVPPFAGRAPIALFGAALIESYRRGEPVAVNDVQTDARFTEEERARLLARQVAAFAGVMMLKGGQWVAVFAVHSATPRVWMREELELISDVSERTWESIQRVQAETALREHERRLTLALAASGGGSWTWDADANRVDWDDRFRALYGFSAEEPPAVDAWAARIHEEDRARLLGFLGEILNPSARDSWDNTFRIVLPGGAVAWMQSLGRADRDAAGHVTRLTGLELDITERRRAEEALLARRDEERDRTLRLLLETANQGILSMDARGVIVTANRALEKMFGWAPGGLVGQSIEQLLPPGLRERYGEYLAAYFAAPSPQTLDASMNLKGQRKDGATFPVEVGLNHVATESGGLAIAFVTDIGERKRAEAALRQSHAVLAERTAELERRTIQLSRLASELILAEQNTREHLARTLHDGLQQVLFSATLRLGRLSMRGLLGGESELLALAQADVDSAISASRSLSMELFPPALHAAGLPTAVIWLAEWMKEKYGLAVHATVDSSANSDRKDVRTLIFESLRELLFNAVKHAQVDRVAVDLALGTDQTLRVTVTDQGIGFDSAALFNPANSQWTGLGLFSIRERLMLLGGRLDVESRPGKGTRFHLVAPLDAARSPAGANPSMNIDAAGQPARAALSESSSRLLRILIVDDHTAVRESLRELLRDRPEFQVVGEASNGLQGITQARALQPDVILMDVSMPEMDGIEATRRIHAEFPFIQIFGLSAHDISENLQAIKQVGGTDYFIKGSGMHRLIDRLLSIRAGKTESRQTAG